MNKKITVLQISSLFLIYVGLMYVLLSIPFTRHILKDFWGTRLIGCIVYSISFAVIAFLVKKIDKKPLSSIGLHANIKAPDVIKGLILGVVLFLIPALPAIAVGYSVSDMGTKLPIDKALIQTVYYFFFVAVVEETMFRGFILTKLFQLTKSKILIVAICSILFGLSHIIGFNLLQFANTTITSIILCIYILHAKNKSLVPLIIAHGLCDSLNVWIPYFFT